jgi:hypothetical protein
MIKLSGLHPINLPLGLLLLLSTVIHVYKDAAASRKM